MIWYTLLVLAVAAERGAELAVARRNARWSLARGGIEYGRGHYPAMVLLHTGLLVGCLCETWTTHRPFVPGVGLLMLGIVVAAQALRWWCVATLGRQWNTRVIVVPGMPLVRKGPYRWLRHPNYIAVAAEGAALPFVHGAWLTALAFTSLNTVLLGVRLRCEESALATAGTPARPASAAAAGTDGATGTAGATGTTGTAGTTGTTAGTAGPAGPAGTAGTAGPAGTAGEDVRA